MIRISFFELLLGLVSSSRTGSSADDAADDGAGRSGLLGVSDGANIADAAWDTAAAAPATR
jgi:hypothetical protein